MILDSNWIAAIPSSVQSGVNSGSSTPWSPSFKKEGLREFGWWMSVPPPGACRGASPLCVFSHPPFPKGDQGGFVWGGGRWALSRGRDEAWPSE